MSAPPAPLMLSVSGARGIVGQSMTPLVACSFAASFGSWVKQQAAQPAAPAVCLGRDSRASGQMLADAAAAGLASVGCRVIDLGLVATPSVGLMIQHRRADGGLVVTAS
ncbi:MAG: phosphoglucosamine mutase, partial [Gemmatimonadetes bacterium]|nr:phosphoglucosamine mutase [Gemmatimonadota bacterium]